MAESRSFLAAALSLTTGTMLFSSLHLLLPESKRHLGYHIDRADAYAYALFFLGILLLQLINTLIHYFAPSALHCHCEDAPHHGAAPPPHSHHIPATEAPTATIPNTTSSPSSPYPRSHHGLSGARSFGNSHPSERDSLLSPSIPNHVHHSGPMAGSVSSIPTSTSSTSSYLTRPHERTRPEGHLEDHTDPSTLFPEDASLCDAETDYTGSSTIGSGDGVFRQPRHPQAPWSMDDEEVSTIYDNHHSSHRSYTRYPSYQGHGSEYPSGDREHQVERSGTRESNSTSQEERSRLSNVGIQTAIAVALHKFPGRSHQDNHLPGSLPLLISLSPPPPPSLSPSSSLEGMITFVGAATSPSLGIALFLGLLAHNIPEGMGVAVPLYAATGSRRTSFLLASLMTGGSQPLGALFGWWILQQGSIHIVCGISFALTAGMMVSVVVDGVWPAALHAAGDRERSVAGYVLLGMAAIVFGILVTGHPH
ncbi:MAG: hypothetical protein DHS80DRAFT_22665 [Piptocephalis tieghemiana]|nr:MAG: hypothetical protein DHS80DRAFT_22665 [Piptocephalis tieghemiana]